MKRRHLVVVGLCVASCWGLGSLWLDAARQRDCLATALYHEARGEPELGQIAVGHVVVNRVEDPAFPDEVCRVIYQGGERRDRCQFSFYCDGRSDEPRDAASYDRARELAEDILDGKTSDPTRGALWYHALGVRPRWSAVFEPVRRLGRHRFYRRARAATN